MADHVRKQIRDAAKTLLTGLSTTADRVEVGRTWPLPQDHQPTLLIYTRDETIRGDTTGAAPKVFRTLQLYVDAHVVASTPPDDTLDQIAKEVEAAFGPNQTFGGLVIGVAPTAIRQETKAEGQRHHGFCRIEFTIEYRTAEGTPDVATP